MMSCLQPIKIVLQLSAYQYCTGIYCSLLCRVIGEGKFDGFWFSFRCTNSRVSRNLWNLTLHLRIISDGSSILPNTAKETVTSLNCYWIFKMSMCHPSYGAKEKVRFVKLPTLQFTGKFQFWVAWHESGHSNQICILSGCRQVWVTRNEVTE